MAGNRSEQTVAFVRDATPPSVALSASGGALEVTVGDPESRTGSLAVTIGDVTGDLHVTRTVPLTFAAGSARARIVPPPLARSRLQVRVQAFDEVGHPSAVATAGLAPGPR
jgi:hypothetical protein